MANDNSNWSDDRDKRAQYDRDMSARRLHGQDLELYAAAQLQRESAEAVAAATPKPVDCACGRYPLSERGYLHDLYGGKHTAASCPAPQPTAPPAARSGNGAPVLVEEPRLSGGRRRRARKDNRLDARGSRAAATPPRVEEPASPEGGGERAASSPPPSVLDDKEPK